MPPTLSVAEAFLEAFVHNEHVLLGRKLRPFCLRHWTLLRALRNRVLFGGIITRQDCFAAALVCSSKSNSEFFSSTNNPTWKDKLWFFKNGNFNVRQFKIQFDAYVSDYLPSFPFWESDTSDSEKIPGFYIAAARLLDLGEEAVFEMPLGALLAWGMARIEASGNPIKTLMTEADIEALREIAKEEPA